MVRDSALRASKFESKLDPAVISARITAQRDSMISQVNQTSADAVTLELAVKTILEKEGISSIFFPSYIGFAKRIAKIAGKFKNNNLTSNTESTKNTEVSNAFNVFRQKGLNIYRLIDISLLFNVSIPFSTVWITTYQPDIDIENTVVYNNPKTNTNGATENLEQYTFLANTKVKRVYWLNVKNNPTDETIVTVRKNGADSAIQFHAKLVDFSVIKVDKAVSFLTNDKIGIETNPVSIGGGTGTIMLIETDTGIFDPIFT